MFDKQYWVRDDGKGGQVIKARCGAEVAVQLLDRSTGQPVVLPDVSIKLYVVSGQNIGPPGIGDPPGGLYLAGQWGGWVGVLGVWWGGRGVRGFAGEGGGGDGFKTAA